MKPNKNLNNPPIDSKKKSLKENSAPKTPKIQTYFKSAPKSFVVEENSLESIKNGDGEDAIKSHYIDDLKKKLHVNADNNENKSSQQPDGAIALVEKDSQHNGVSYKKTQINSIDEDSITSTECAGCMQKTAELIQKANESKEWERKYKELKKVYLKLTVNFTEEHSKFSDLLKVVTNTTHKEIDGPTTPRDDIFTQNEIRVLQGMSRDKDKDATFIRESLQYVYKGDLNIFKSRTLKGTREWTEITKDGQEKHHPAKEAFTPEKVDRIKELFIERISTLTIDSATYAERMQAAYINRLFAAGIKNIAKKQQ